MQLDREYILRMIKGRSAGAVVVEGGEGGGGGGGVTLGPLLTSLNTEAMPSAEGYLHWSGTAWEWTTPTGGDPVDLTPYALKTWVQNNFATLNDISGLLTKAQADGYYAPISFVKPYLPLAAGSSYPLTGSLYINGSNNGIQWSGNKGMLCYKPSSGWSGVTSTQWGVGSHDANGIIRSGSALERYDGTNNYTIYDSSNLNPLAYATKDQLSGYLPLTGGEVGDLTVNGTVIAEGFLTSELEELATENWVEGAFLPFGGGTLTGNLRLKNSTNYGMKLLFGDSEYCYLHEDTDDHLKVYAKDGVTVENETDRILFITPPDYLYFTDANNVNEAWYYTGTSAYDFYRSLLIWLCEQYGEVYIGKNVMFVMKTNPNSLNMAMLTIYNPAVVDGETGLPQYALGMAITLGNSQSLASFGSFAYAYYYNGGKVAEAAKLSTARTLWSQPFDGSGNISGDLAVTNAEVKVSNGNGGWVHQMVHTASGANESTYKFYVSQNAQNSTPVTGYEFDKDVKVKKLIADEVQADNINAGLDVIMDDVSVDGKTGRLYVERGDLYYQYDNGTPVRLA